METVPTPGSIVQVRGTGHRGTVARIGGASTSGVQRPVVFVSARLHEVGETWEHTQHEVEALDLVLAAPYIQPDVCLYCWGPVPEDRKPRPAPEWPAGARTTPKRTKASHYCTREHQVADDRWERINKAERRKAVAATPNGRGGLGSGVKKPGPGRQTITPPPEGRPWSMALQTWT